LKGQGTLNDLPFFVFKFFCAAIRHSDTSRQAHLNCGLIAAAAALPFSQAVSANHGFIIFLPAAVTDLHFSAAYMT
jgi:hypothetical protein